MEPMAGGGCGWGSLGLDGPMAGGAYGWGPKAGGLWLGSHG